MSLRVSPSQRSWVRRISAFAASIVVSGALGMTDASQVDAQSIESTVTRTYLNKPLIHLPIEIDNPFRAQIQSLVLYAKESPQGPWVIKDKAAPMQTAFTFRAPADGEYWFRIVAIDTKGKAHPEDLNKDIQDAVVVVVDSQAPSLQISLQSPTPEGQVVRCDQADANTDTNKLRFFYQTRDQVWRPLESLPDNLNLFCIPAQAAVTNMIRVMATDLAGNTTQKVLNLGELAARSPSTPPTTPVAGASTPGALPVGTQGAAVKPAETIVQVAPPAALPPALSQEVMTPILPAPPTPARETGAQPINPPIRHAKTPSMMGPSLESTMPGTPRNFASEMPGTAEVHTVAGILSKQPRPESFHLVGAPTVQLNYAVENVGASGVGKMEVWVTRDQGQSWQRLVEDAGRKSPAEISLPGEGMFGLKLLAYNGRGFTTLPPQPGDPADYWVEVDMTRPKATITGIRTGIGTEAGSVTVQWSAEDKNLSAEPVELYYAPSREGPWTLISKGLKAVGQHRWVPPQEAGAQAYLRLVVRDRANNHGMCETVQAMPLDDMSRPRIRLINVTTPTHSPIVPASNTVPQPPIVPVPIATPAGSVTTPTGAASSGMIIEIR